MTENNRFGGIFGTKDPDLNIPVTGTSVLSPYANLNPRLLQDNDNYILSEGAKGHHRGKFERAFSQIGGFILGGAAAGGCHGLYTGIKETRSLGTLKDSVRRTQILNITMKQGASSAQALGTIGFTFSVIETGLSAVGSTDEDLNTVISGASTGVLYKSAAGLKGIRVGLAAGLGLSVAYTLLTSPRIWANY